MYHLATNPQCQNTLREEARNLLTSPEDVVTTDVLQRATYTKAALKESLRLNPISIGVGRILQADTVLSGYRVPKGVNI